MTKILEASRAMLKPMKSKPANCLKNVQDLHSMTSRKDDKMVQEQIYFWEEKEAFDLQAKWDPHDLRPRHSFPIRA
jgi:hypothetical protein